MKGVDAVAKILQLEGVEYLFSYPNHPLIEAAAKIGIRPIIARSEKTLINIADGYTRALNATKPTVVVTQGGPGIENAFGGLAQAASDGVPLLVIPGGGDAARLGAGEFDPLPVYNHIMKWTGRINLPSRIPELMNRAFSQLRNGKLGPVLLELPRDTGNADVDDPEGVYSPPKAYRSAGDPSDVSEAVSMLLAAKRPVLHAGHGVLWAQAWDELRELAELLQIPVMTTMAGKSAFPGESPAGARRGRPLDVRGRCALPGQVRPGVRRRVQLREGLVLVPDPGRQEDRPGRVGRHHAGQGPQGHARGDRRCQAGAAPGHRRGSRGPARRRSTRAWPKRSSRPRTRSWTPGCRA